MVFPDHTHLQFFMKSSPLFMKILSFETINCLNYNMQRQKRHTVTKGVKVNFLGFAFFPKLDKHAISCLPTFFIIISMWATEFAEKLTLVNFCLKFA